jgi:flagellar biosynthetic protein FlhB
MCRRAANLFRPRALHEAPMADSSKDDKTEQPTGKRLGDAREKGNVPRSRDLGHVMMLGSAGVALLVLSGPMTDASVRLVRAGLHFDAQMLDDPARMVERMSSLVGDAALAFAPLLAVFVVACMVSPIALGGLMFSTQLLEPNFSKLNPLPGFAKFFSLSSLIEVGKSILICTILGAVGWSYMRSHVEDFAQLASMGLEEGLPQMGHLVLTALLMMVSGVAATAAIDVPWQIYRHRRDLMMTPEEVKREGRDADGDPAIKQRIKQRGRELARKRMMAAVPKADVVVTNPTHFAVALKYLEGKRRAPVVVAKGMGEVAARIREVARANGVAELSAPPLARALHQHVEIGDEIPAALYTAVAQVLAYVFQLQRHAAAGGVWPQAPADIEVPDGMDPYAPGAGAGATAGAAGGAGPGTANGTSTGTGAAPATDNIRTAA